MSICFYAQPVDVLIYDFDKQFNSISPCRQERVNSYKQQSDKILCLAASILLDKALAAFYLREKDMEYCFSEHGKPYFKNRPDLFFSLSHSGSYAMAAVSDKEIGCDIQQIKKIDLKISKRFFTEYENDYIKNTLDFFRVWTLKESFIKLVGTGLSIPLNSFCVENLRDKPYVDYNGSRYVFIENKIGDYYLSICQMDLLY